MREVLAQVAEILREDGGLVLARVVGCNGSAPRNAGARMIVRRGGAIEGTVGGGLAEAYVMERAGGLFNRKVSAVWTLDMNGVDVTGTDMICGGSMKMLCEYVHADEETIGTFDQIDSRSKVRWKRVLMTEFKREGAGLYPISRRLFCPDTLHEQASANRDLMTRIEGQKGSLAGSALIETDGGTVCIDVVEDLDPLYIFGAGHVAREVAVLGCRVGFGPCVLDDRAEFANAERFPPPMEARVLDSFSDCFHGLHVDSHSFVVIVTRGHEHDRTVLKQALGTKAGYIGMIGSTRKRDIIYGALVTEGFMEDDLRRVHSPIGIAIDAGTPEEIAVSIVAELIKERAKRR